jgi:hypothetical protein
MTMEEDMDSTLASLTELALDPFHQETFARDVSELIRAAGLMPDLAALARGPAGAGPIGPGMWAPCATCIDPGDDPSPDPDPPVDV